MHTRRISLHGIFFYYGKLQVVVRGGFFYEKEVMTIVNVYYHNKYISKI